MKIDSLPRPLSIADDHYKYVVFKNPEWDFKTLDFDKDLALADTIDGGALNANDPDLKAFAAHGGKLIMYHGWNDQLIAPQNSIDYYTSISRKMGAAETDRFARLFMVPGMMHCAGGVGPNQFEPLAALEQWREHGTLPVRMLATHATGGIADRTRPLCAYPRVAVYKGSGSTDDAANFECKAQ